MKTLKLLFLVLGLLCAAVIATFWRELRFAMTDPSLVDSRPYTVDLLHGQPVLLPLADVSRLKVAGVQFRLIGAQDVTAVVDIRNMASANAAFPDLLLRYKSGDVVMREEVRTAASYEHPARLGASQKVLLPLNLQDGENGLQVLISGGVQ